MRPTLCPLEPRGLGAALTSFVLLIAAGCGGASSGGPSSSTTSATGLGTPATTTATTTPTTPTTPTTGSGAISGLVIPAAGTVPATWFENDDPQAGSLRDHSSTQQALADEVLALTNAFRQSQGLPALLPDPLMQVAAKAHAEDLARRDYFTHDTRDFDFNGQTVSGFDPFVRMGRVGASFNTAGENIAAGYPTAAAVMDGWENSPGHRANLLGANFTHLGVGVAEGGSFGITWSQNFRAGGNAP